MNINNNLLFPEKFFDTNSPFSYFRAPPVYLMPAAITISKLLEIVTISGLKLSSEV